MAFSLLFKGSGTRSDSAHTSALPVDLLHRAGCAACPLNHTPGLHHPKMDACGATNPDIFVLGEAPGEREDIEGKAFVGPAGKCLRLRIPRDWVPRIRWGNTIRCRPPKNRDPSPTETECCRGYVEQQIAESRPRAVLGFGNHALRWATGQTGIHKWRGRKLPVVIGGHQCWFFPIVHPSSILHNRRFEPRGVNEYGSDDEFAFAWDVRTALAQVDTLPDPVIHDRAFAEENVSWVTGHGGWNDVDTIRRFLEWATQLAATGTDLETLGRRPFEERAKILTAAVSGANATLAFPIDHRGAGWSREQRDTVIELYVNYLRNARGAKTVHNLAFELEWFAYLIDPTLARAGRWDCTMVQAFILDHRSRMGKPDAQSLELLCLQYFGINVKDLARLNKDNLDDEPLVEVLRYNGIDGKYHLALFNAQSKRLLEVDMAWVYEDRVRHVPTIVLTQLQGQPVDAHVVSDLDAEYSGRMVQLVTDINSQPLALKYKARFGKIFRPSANDDVKQLCRMVGLSVDSADESAVAQLNDPIREPLMQWKKLAKAHSTYIKPQVELVWPDGLLHSQISLTWVDTGRTSCTGPNNQNYPKRNAEHKRVRATFTAEAWRQRLEALRDANARYKHVVVSFDWGQIQARGVAMESLDENLIQAFWDEYDIHSSWRDRLIEIYPQWVVEGPRALLGNDKPSKALAKAYRNRSKNEFVFASLFGATAKGCAMHLGVPERIGEKLQEEFWDKFPGVAAWHKRKRAEVFTLGYVTGHSGLRRYAPLSQNEVINTPIQADETVIVLDAMTRCSEAELQAFLEIHDDLSFIWPECKLDEYAEIALDIMLNPVYEWAKVVPTVVEMSVGPNWADLEEVGVYTSAKWG